MALPSKRNAGDSDKQKQLNAIIDHLGGTPVSGLDADKLDSQEGTYYRNASNLNAGTVPLAQIPATLTGKDADTVDTYHAKTSGADAHVLATDASGNATVTGTLTLGSQITQETNVIRKVFSVPLTDSGADNVFHITTTNETGNNDGGGYVCFINGLIFDGSSTVDTAVKGWKGVWARAVGGTGAIGVNTAMTEIVETLSAATAAATRDIGAVAIGLVEVSEYDVYVQAVVDHTGTGDAMLRGVFSVELIWYGFLTPPVLAAA